jgi:hypothetical protein
VKQQTSPFEQFALFVHERAAPRWHMPIAVQVVPPVSWAQQTWVAASQVVAPQEMLPLEPPSLPELPELPDVPELPELLEPPEEDPPLDADPDEPPLEPLEPLEEELAPPLPLALDPGPPDPEPLADASSPAPGMGGSSP